MVESGASLQDIQNQPRPETGHVQKPKARIKTWQRLAAVVAGLSLPFALSACSPDRDNATNKGTSITTTAEPGHYNVDPSETNVLSSLSTSLNPDNFGLKGKYTEYNGTRIFKDVQTETFHSNDGTTLDVIPLLKVTMVNDKLDLVASQPDVDEITISWIQSGLGELEPYLKAAFKQGTLQEVVLGTEKQAQEAGSQYSNIDKKLFYAINFNEPTLSTQEMQKTFLHETGHALFSDKSISLASQEIADIATISQFTEACKAVRDVAIDEMEESFYEMENELNQLGSLDKGSAAVFQKIIALAREGNLNGLYPTNPEDVNAKTETPTCEFTSMSGVIGSAKKQLYPKGAPRANRSPQAIDIYVKLDQQVEDFARNASIYMSFTDETYTHNIGGDPQRNLDETAASMFMITALFPDVFSGRLHALDVDKREKVLRLYNLVMQQYMQNPELAKVLQEKVAKVNA